MADLLTAAQMRAMEAAAIASGAVTGLELMERAGRGVVVEVLKEWPAFALTPQRTVVLCGPGNNGGDGFVVARLLAERGWAVRVYLYGDAARLPQDARANYDRWRSLGAVHLISATSEVPQDFDLIVDAVFGTGLTRPIGIDLVQFVAAMTKDHKMGQPEYAVKVVAVDILSGICANSGKVVGALATAFADMTVTFHCAKLGHCLDQGGLRTRSLRIVDIGLQDHEKAGGSGIVQLASPSVARLSKHPFVHKFNHGHALIVSGDHGRAGAARLAARAALRVGAGVVTVASPPAAMAENAARLDAIMLREVGWAKDLAVVLDDARINALCLGPGMGAGAREAEMLAMALRHSGQARPVVLDADALTLLSRDPALFAALHIGCVLTPHAGEFARLFPDIAAKLAAPATQGPAYSKVDATREAAARAGCVVLYKGADTVIATPDGRCAVNAALLDRSAPWLATAGSGDVLAGFITGLLARATAPFEAACTGAWLHVDCARAFGPGLIAEDLPEMVPNVLRALAV